MSKFVRRADGAPVMEPELIPADPEEQGRYIRRQARIQEARLWVAMIQLTGVFACLIALLHNPGAFLPQPLPGDNAPLGSVPEVPATADPELLERTRQQMLEWQRRMEREREDIQKLQEEALRTLERARTTLDGRPIGSDARQMQVKLGDGRVLDNLEDAAAWLKRMASKLGTARLSLEDIDVLLETDDVDWALSVSLPEEVDPLRLALASRLWIVLLFTPEDMRYVKPRNDEQTTGHGRIGLLFVVPRVPYDQRGERY